MKKKPAATVGKTQTGCSATLSMKNAPIPKNNANRNKESRDVFLRTKTNLAPNPSRSKSNPFIPKYRTRQVCSLIKLNYTSNRVSKKSIDDTSILWKDEKKESRTGGSV